MIFNRTLRVILVFIIISSTLIACTGNEDKTDNSKVNIIPNDYTKQEDFFLSELSILKNNKEGNTVGSELSMSSLENILWVYNPQKFNDMALWFYPSGEFFIGTNYQGVWLTTGEYEIIDSETIHLFNFDGNLGIIGFSEISDEFNLKLAHNSRNFYYEELLYIDGTNEFFGNINTYPGDEGIFELNGIEVIKESGYYVTNDRVKFRTEPNTKSETKPVYYFEGKKDYFARGTQIYVVARSNQKYKIDSYNNYWYYIYHSSDEYNAVGWVYGEFIEPYNKELEDQYYEIYKNDVQKIFGN